VSELTSEVRRTLEEGFGSVAVSGEVSNWRLQASGHAYFVLKDARSQLACVLFRGQAVGTRDQLRDGAHVILTGELTVYEPRGQYQLRVLGVELEGVGALQAAFEKLKARLQAEGLFDAARKRPIPRFPRRVGLVTSPSGAAIRDVLHVVARRYAGLEFVLVPVRVQGAGAAEEISAAVALLNAYDEAAGAGAGEGLDAILVTRGGGSLEDLWAFNEEGVARSLAASRVPVISAVGHEIDFTIADFVADLRAATPSAAAELLTAGYVDSRVRVAEGVRRLQWLARRHLEDQTSAADGWRRRLARMHPRRGLAERAQRLDDAVETLRRIAARCLEDHRRQEGAVRQRLAASRPSAVVSRWRRELADWQRRLPRAAALELEARRPRLARLVAGLRMLSPEQVLQRGYSITFNDADGAVVRSPDEVTPGQRLRTRVRDGEIESEVRGGLPWVSPFGVPPSGGGA